MAADCQCVFDNFVVFNYICVRYFPMYSIALWTLTPAFCVFPGLPAGAASSSRSLRAARHSGECMDTRTLAGHGNRSHPQSLKDFNGVAKG